MHWFHSEPSSSAFCQRPCMQRGCLLHFSVLRTKTWDFLNPSANPSSPTISVSLRQVSDTFTPGFLQLWKRPHETEISNRPYLLESWALNELYIKYLKCLTHSKLHYKQYLLLTQHMELSVFTCLLSPSFRFYSHPSRKSWGTTWVSYSFSFVGH